MTNGAGKDSPVTQQTVPIAATTAGSPESVYTIYKAVRRARLSSITIANTQTPGNPEQVWVGVRYLASTGTSDWDALVSPYMEGGDVFGWEGSVYLAAGDEIVAYGSVGSYSTVTIGVEEL